MKRILPAQTPSEHNPDSRAYTPTEIAAAIRVGEARWETARIGGELVRIVHGPIIWGSPTRTDHHENLLAEARKRVADLEAVASAFRRETNQAD